MVTHARTGVVTLLIGCVLVMSQLVLISPAAAAASPDGPNWVPAQSSLPASAVQRDPNYIRLLGDRAMWNANNGSNLTGSPTVPGAPPPIVNTGTHAQMQAAAARGAYVPGLSDYARANNISPSQVTAAQAGSSYANYAARPGSAGMLSATANSKGVFTITTLKSPSIFTKAGNAMGAAIGTAATVATGFELGYAVGGGLSHLLGLPTGSGSAVCDIATVVGSDRGCGLAAVEEYQPNADVGLVMPGWVGSPTVKVIWTNCGNGSGCTGSPKVETEAVFTDPHAPAFGTAGSFYPAMSISPNPFTTKARIDRGTIDGSHGDLYYRVLNSVGVNVGDRTNPFPDTVPGSQAPINKAIAAPSTWDHIQVSQQTKQNGAFKEVTLATWYPPGHQLRPPDVEDDPLRSWLTTWTCTSGPGGSASSESFRETDETWPAPANVECASGEAKTIKVEQITLGLPPVTVYEWSLPEETQGFLEDYPECANGSCVLDLRTTKTGVETSCFQSPELCTDWIKDPNRDTDFQCYYAETKVAMSECFLYGPTFNRTEVTNGSPYGHPETGEPLTPSTPAPGGGGSNEPPEDPNCPPPFSVTSVLKPWWYYKGLECGLRWAFVPSGVGGVTSGIFGAYEASAASGLVGSTKELLSIPMNGQCGVLFSVQPSVFGGQTFSVDTCSEFWTGAAPIRSLLGVSMVLLATIAGVRIALTSLGVTMFDGKGSP